MTVTMVITLVSWWLGYALMGWFTYYCTMAFSRYCATKRGDRWDREHFERDGAHVFPAIAWPLVWPFAFFAFAVYLIVITSRRMFFSVAQLLNRFSFFYGLFDR